MRPSERLVGRQAEVAWLEAGLAALTAGRGGVQVMTGPPGIGKTRLLDEAAARAPERLLVLRGRASELEQAFPFGVIIDALDDYLRALPASPLAEIDPVTDAELALVFPALRARRPDVTALGQPTADDRVRAYYAIRSLLEVLAERHPLALLLDDLHWADRASVELVAHLTRRPPRTPVLIVATYREHRVDPDLAQAVERSASEQLADVRRIGPLSVEEAGQLVGRDDFTAQRWHSLSGGNPLLLLELGRAGGELAAQDGVGAVVASAIERELRPLSPAARRLVESAATVGDPFDYDLAVAVAELDHDTSLGALDEIAAHGLVRETELPRRFAFRHPLVRHAVYASLRPGQQLAAHERCVAVLRERGASPVELAHHVEHAARPGDLAAVDLLARAAEAMAARAPASAVRWLRSAARLLPGSAGDRQRLRLLEPLPALHLSLGELEEAHECLLQALAVVTDDEPTRRTQLATACAGVEQLLGDYDAASARLDRALADLPPGADEESVAVSVALVMDCFYRRRHDAMLDHGRQAVAVADRNGDPQLRAKAHAALALGGALIGAIDPARAHRDVAAELIDGLADEELAQRVDAIGMLAGAELYLDLYPEAVAHGGRGIAIGRATGTTASAPTLIPCVGTALWVVGRLDDSITMFDEAVEAARASRDRIALVWRLLNLSYAQVKAGQFDAALAVTDEGLPLALLLSDSVIVSLAAGCRATAMLSTGDPAGALRIFREHCGPDLEALPGGWRTQYLDAAVTALLELGEVAEAERMAAVARDLAATVDLPYARSLAAASTARCHLHRGDAPAAVAAARAAVHHAEEVSGRLDAALLRILLGRASAAAGDVDGAVAVLREAAAALDAMGAVRHRDRAELELGRLGHRPRRRTRPGTATTGAASLTEREREIADLLAERCTNPEIAARLYLSPRTVETHVRNIFRKLDVTTRVDAGRAWRSGRR